MKPWPSTAPLPAFSQALSVALGMKAPVWPTQLLLPASAVAFTTPGVTSAWLDAAAEVIDETKVLACTPLPPGQ